MNIELSSSTREMIISLYKTHFLYYSREDPLLWIPSNLDFLLRTALESFDFDQTALSTIIPVKTDTNRLSIPKLWKQKRMLLTSYGSSTKMKWKWIDERLDVIESWGTSITRTDSPTSARTRISFKWNQAAFATYDKCSQERDGSMSDNVQAAFLSEGFFRRPGHLPNIPEG